MLQKEAADFVQGDEEREGGGEEGEVCANRVRYFIDVCVHFFVKRQRNRRKKTFVRGCTPYISPLGLCAFCPSGTKFPTSPASLLLLLIVRFFN